jgi:quercetin dioxygenase-like cupin family protein
MGYTKVNINEVEPAGPTGAVRFVRRELGLEAFGINWFELPPNSEGVYHEEKDSGQEEVNVIIRGSGTYVIDGEEVPAQAGDVFRFDPETERGPKAGPDGLTMLAVGAPRGSYQARGPF